MAELEQALFTRLSTHAGLSALVSTRVYPLVAPQNPTLPYVTYQRVASSRVSAMGTDPGVAEALMQIDCWGETYLSALSVATKARLALERWRDGASDPEVLDAFIERDQDVFEDEAEPPLYRRSMDVRVWHREATT
jgi:hypothetical protein